jgi:hypothetical protein
MCFVSDNIRLSDGGLKSKPMIQAGFTILFRRKEFKGDGKGGGEGGEVTVFKSIPLLLCKDVE